MAWLDGAHRRKQAEEQQQVEEQRRWAADRERKRALWESGYERATRYGELMEEIVKPDLVEMARKTWGDDGYLFQTRIGKGSLPWEGSPLHHSCRWTAREKGQLKLGFEVSVIFEGNGTPRTIFVGSGNMAAPSLRSLRWLRWVVRMRLRRALTRCYVRGPEDCSTRE